MSKLSEIMSRAKSPVVATTGVGERAFGSRAAPVDDSDDLTRILALPTREPPTQAELTALVDKWTTTLHRPGIPTMPGDIYTLKPVQAWSFEEASTWGFMGHIIVGGGKTGIDILLPMVVRNIKQALLLIPSNLRAQFLEDFKKWSKHFIVPNLAGSSSALFYSDRPALHTLTYSELSNTNAATRITTIDPDMIIADEAQNLKDMGSVRTSRFIRHFVEKPKTLFFPMSGSLTTRGIADYAHLSALALREGSPLPIEQRAVVQWGGALDPTLDCPSPAGALRKLCLSPGESVRAAFCRRRNTTRGVVTTDDARLPVALKLTETTPGELPEAVQKALSSVRALARRPDGEELIDDLEVATVARQLACGFFYRWKYPRGEPADLIEEWFSRRQAWHKELRERLKYRVTHMDSPALCVAAAKRAEAGYKGELPVWRATFWRPWENIREQVQPEQDTVWIDDFAARAAVQWAQADTGIVWYLHSSFGRKVAELGHLPFFGAGEDASAAILTEQGNRSIVCSIKAHGTGKNLQAFHRMLICNPMSDGGAWEQLLGREHRPGQTRDVFAEVWTHTEEMQDALDNACKYAQYVQETTGAIQKILYALD